MTIDYVEAPIKSLCVQDPFRVFGMKQLSLKRKPKDQAIQQDQILLQGRRRQLCCYTPSTNKKRNEETMAETKEFPMVDIEGATYTPKNILITGGAGAFGWRLVAHRSVGIGISHDKSLSPSAVLQ